MKKTRASQSISWQDLPVGELTPRAISCGHGLEQVLDKKHSRSSHFSLLYQRGCLASPAEMIGLPSLKQRSLAVHARLRPFLTLVIKAKETNAFPAVFAN